MLKKTKLITYNLKDRGRLDTTGINRNDVDIQSWINAINSPVAQELVNSGDMLGYYGHETRQRFGIMPPDTFVNDAGETIIIEPAIRTILQSADNDGNVTVQYEFMNTTHGKFALQLYETNVGGFSGVAYRNPAKNSAGKHEVTGSYGGDYVKQPNYNTHRGNAQFDALILDSEECQAMYDSLVQASPQKAMLNRALETAIMSQYDSIATVMQANNLIEHYQNEAMSAQSELIAKHKRAETKRAMIERRKNEVYDSLICPSRPFNEVMAQYDSFTAKGTSDADLVTTHAKKEQDKQTSQPRARRSLFSRGQY